jgi:hypothetical protein
MAPRRAGGIQAAICLGRRLRRSIESTATDGGEGELVPRAGMKFFRRPTAAAQLWACAALRRGMIMTRHLCDHRRPNALNGTFAYESPH